MSRVSVIQIWYMTAFLKASTDGSMTWFGSEFQSLIVCARKLCLYLFVLVPTSLTVHLDGVFMSIRIWSDESHCKPGCSQLKMLCQICLKVTRPVLRISRSFEGHCALTNADGANEVQQNVVTATKGKKARHKSNITSFQVNNPYL